MKKNKFRIKITKDLFLKVKSCMIIIYCILIKKIIREKILMKNKFNYNIEYNIINAYKFIKEGNNKFREKNHKPKAYQKCSIKWMIEFYSKKQINKNIWISISSKGFVIIYSLNLLIDSKT